MEHNINAPHVCHLRVVYEIMEKLPTKEASGWPIKDRVFNLIINGSTFEECKTKTDTLFDKIKDFVDEVKHEYN